MTYLLVDILPLKPGNTLDDAISYFEELKPVFERHGLIRLDRPLQSRKTLRGEIDADMVNLFETDNPERSLPGLQGDPDYQAKVPARDRIFDLERATILMTERC